MRNKPGCVFVQRNLKDISNFRTLLDKRKAEDIKINQE